MIFMRRVKLFFDVMRRRCQKVYMPSNDNACFSVKRKKYFSRRRKTLCHVLRYPENFMEWMPFERGNLKNASCTKMIRRGGVKTCRCLRRFCTGRSMAGRTFRPECGRLVKDVGEKKRGLALPAWGAADVRHPAEPDVNACRTEAVRHAGMLMPPQKRRGVRRIVPALHRSPARSR